MNILFLSQVLPYPLDAGPKMRSYFVLRHLAQKHQVTLLTFVRGTDRSQDITHLAEFCHAVYPIHIQRTKHGDARFLARSLLTAQPFLIVRDHNSLMMQKLLELVRSETFDLIHADQLWMAQYALAAKAASPKTKVVLDQHNAVHLIPRRLGDYESNVLKRWFLSREAHVLATYEAKVCRQFDRVVWVTEEDRRAVAALSSEIETSPAVVIPICADPEQVSPIESNSTKYRITFLGGLHWPPNAQGIVWFAKHIFPQVRAAIPEATLTVIGKNPPQELKGKGIEVTGYVTDLKPYLAETGAFIVPLHAGGGMRVKILDAWSWGLPIVSTSIGAEGISIRPGDNILIADTVQAFAEAVIQVLRDPTLAQQLGQAGRQTVLEKYNWQITYAVWDQVYQKNGQS